MEALYNFPGVNALSNMPGVTVLAPSCEREYEAMSAWAVRQQGRAIVLAVSTPLPQLDYELDTEYDAANTSQQVREGHGVAVIAAGTTLQAALEASDRLAAEGKKLTVINARFLSGIDCALLSSLEPDHQAVLTVEAGELNGGYGQKVAAFFGDRPMLVRCLAKPAPTSADILDALATMWT